MDNVTVLIPSYNHGSLLVYQVESLLRQSSPPRRIFIVDDGSTDNTLELLQRFVGNEIVRVIPQKKNLGVHAATDLLLNHVDTELFAFAAADDLLTRDWCETMGALLVAHPSAKMAISNAFIFENGAVSLTDAIRPPRGQSDGVYTPAQFSEALRSHGKLPPSNTIMYRSDIIEEVVRPVFRNQELSSLTDILLILAVATRYPVAYSTKPTGVSVKHRDSYGHAFFSREHLRRLVSVIDVFSRRDRFIEDAAVVDFVTRYTRYSWVKQMVLSSLAANKRDNAGFKYLYGLVRSYGELLAAFVANRRFLYLRFRTKPQRNPSDELKAVLDPALMERLNVA